METYNLNTILSNLHSGNNNMEWKRMYNLCRDHIAFSSRYARRIRIQQKQWWELKRNGIFNKVIVTLNNGDLIPSYTAEMTSKEITDLKRIFDPLH